MAVHGALAPGAERPHEPRRPDARRAGGAGGGLRWVHLGGSAQRKLARGDWEVVLSLMGLAI